MTTSPAFDERPIVVALAGPNGAGKTTFYHAHLAPAGLRFVNADVLALELGLNAAEAMAMAGALRHALERRRDSFVFETVFSDPVGDKLSLLTDTASDGYTVVLCYIGIASAEQSDERVAMRVTQGGHDVPPEKLQSRFPRTVANLHAAIRILPHVLVFDNSDLLHPYRLVARFEHARGQCVTRVDPLPPWLEAKLEG
ncbi:MAG: zeta toxin family protein [Acidobacteriota bacterium]|nr:zeta toxin family protein [Acidobacteriota bacterium]